MDLVRSQKVIVLVGNKNDLEEDRQVTTTEGQDTAKNWGIPPTAFMEVSATNNELVMVNIISRLHFLEVALRRINRFRWLR